MKWETVIGNYYQSKGVYEGKQWFHLITGVDQYRGCLDTIENNNNSGEIFFKEFDGYEKINPEEPIDYLHDCLVGRKKIATIYLDENSHALRNIVNNIKGVK